MSKTVTKSLYILLFPASKCFIVIDSVQPRWQDVYRDHRRGRISTTREAFISAAESGEVPHMYELGTVICTDAAALRWRITWSYYFHTHGYKTLAGPKMEQYIAALDPDTDAFYQKIVHIPIKDTLHAKRNLIAPHIEKVLKTTPHRDTGKKKVEVLFSKTEWNLYRKAATEQGLSMAEFVRQRLRADSMPDTKDSGFVLCLRELRRNASLLDGIAKAVALTGACAPEDIAALTHMAQRTEQVMADAMRLENKRIRQLQKITRGKGAAE